MVGCLFGCDITGRMRFGNIGGLHISSLTLHPTSQSGALLTKYNTLSGGEDTDPKPNRPRSNIPYTLDLPNRSTVIPN